MSPKTVEIILTESEAESLIAILKLYVGFRKGLRSEVVADAKEILETLERQEVPSK
jgi:hypothetical protein